MTTLQWTPNDMIEIFPGMERFEEILKNPNSKNMKMWFSVIRDQLSRIGVANRDIKVLTQSCHIILENDKNGKPKYYLTHFKELLAYNKFRKGLEYKFVMDETDLTRRNTIAKLLFDWGYIDVLDHNILNPHYENPFNKIWVLSKTKIKEENWTLKSKYSFKKLDMQL